MRLKKYPTRIIPTVQIAIKMPSSFGLIAFFSIIIDGSESVITPISELDIVATFNLIDNVAPLAERGIACVLAVEGAVGC